jgi:signal transduction histidine kinase
VTHGKANGTGLGLAISKAVVEAHRGLIWVKSSSQGTVFTIDLPLEA